MNENQPKTVRMDESKSEQLNTIRLESNGHEQKTIRMDETNEVDKTIRMDENQPTVRMDTHGTNNDPLQSPSNGYIQIGDVLAGKYKIVRNLTYNTGEATLFICEYENKTYVAKVYHENMKPKDDVRDRIYSIQSDYVIPVLDHGTDERSQRFYEIVPYYENGDLTTQKEYDIDFLMNVVARCLNEGLHAIHEAGVIHRDIKPNNLFFNEDRSSIIIGDFGISSTLEQGSVVFTGNANRTNGYAAPEVYNRLISKESDYYSLGITLLELAMGENPFKHLTEEQILKMTLMDPLHIPNTLPERFTTLVKGLTRKDRNKRWGYEEVKKWLNGEHVHLAEDTVIRNIRPYRFVGRETTSLEELMVLFANNWEEAKKHLYRGLVKDFAAQFGQDYELIVIECEEIRNQDVGLHKLITQLHPSPPFCWKGKVYEDLGALGEEMKKILPDVHRPSLQMLKYRLFTSYIKKISGDSGDKDSKEFYHELKRLEKLVKEDETYAYYQLAFLLGRHDEFRFQNHTVSTVDELVRYLHENGETIDHAAKQLIESSYFYAWLAHQGYEQHVNEWRRAIQ